MQKTLYFYFKPISLYFSATRVQPGRQEIRYQFKKVPLCKKNKKGAQFKNPMKFLKRIN